MGGLRWDRDRARSQSRGPIERVQRPRRQVVSVSNLDELERLIFGPDSDAALAERLRRVKRRGQKVGRRPQGGYRDRDT